MTSTFQTILRASARIALRQGLTPPIVTSVTPLVLMAALLSCSRPKPPLPSAVGGALTVLVRPPDRAKDMLPVSNTDSLPVQSGGAMCLDVELDEPAFVYLVWIDSTGQVLPLYPWNNETLEVNDVSQPPPVRRPTKRIFSPLLGRSWTFSDAPGTETVVLLARQTALPTSVNIAQLLSSPPRLPADHRDQHVEACLPANAFQPDGRAPEAALKAYLAPLATHFDIIHGLQFMHAERANP